MMKVLPLTPLMTISLTLTIGIIIAKWGYDDFNMRFWLIISIISCALSSIIFFLTKFLSKKAYFSRSHQFLIYSQCVMIHLCILSLGSFLTCKQIADSQTSTQLKTGRNCLTSHGQKSIPNAIKAILKANWFPFT